jgi:hypothetical protein
LQRQGHVLTAVSKRGIIPEAAAVAVASDKGYIGTSDHIQEASKSSSIEGL